MKNLFILLLTLVSLNLSAQFATSVQVEYGGNYAALDGEAFTGVQAMIRGNVTNQLEANFGMELGFGVGYSSLSNSYKTTAAQITMGFTDNSFMSGGVIVQYMDKNDVIAAGLYFQQNYPVVRNEMRNSVVDLFVRGSVVFNALEFNNMPTTLNGSLGLRYNF